ncbi:MAG: phosphate/phosphite/phosphonate ABC transporter substrate-binding protein [Syntrophales bacterium]|nr:phosphate/phosphite/phosphonate ABC transporter substrate-binding protein [Syntrophales bacterium]
MPHILKSFPKLRIIFVIFLILFLSGCQEQNGPQTITAVSNLKMRKTLTIGIVPEENVFELKKKYLPLMKYLSNKLDMKVQVKLLDSYGAVDGAISRGDIEGAILGSAGVIKRYEKHSIDLIARPQYSGSNSFYKAFIIAEKSSGITKDINTWKGKKLALAHERTTTSIFVRWYLRKRGINSERQIFRKVEYAGSHDAVIILILERNAAIGGVKDSVLKRFMDRHPAYRGRFAILAESAPAPENTLVVSSRLPKDIKNLLKKTLLEIHDDPEGQAALKVLGADRFVATNYAEYAAIENMLHDLASGAKIHQSSPFADK